ncbi:MAG: hypothetical protein ACKESB_03255 [Candidatus Hodgkinia cicadicola]
MGSFNFELVFQRELMCTTLAKLVFKAFLGPEAVSFSSIKGMLLLVVWGGRGN